jgi:hypothetical protein
MRWKSTVARSFISLIARYALIIGATIASTTIIGAEKPLAQIIRLPEAGTAPQAATDDRGHIYLIYFKGDPAGGDIFYVHSDDGGQTLTKPIRVNSQAGSAMVIGTVRVPQLAVGKGGRVHVAWMGSKTAEPKAVRETTPMLYTRLNDAGDAFEPQRNLITRHPGLDGGGSVAADTEGNVYVAWHAPDNGHGEADRCIWVIRSEDNGRTFSSETAINPPATGVCGCCGMKIAAGTGGRVYVLYRSATKVVNRDMYLLASSDHAKTFALLNVDPWQSGACVMSTSAIQVSDMESIAAWETKGHIRFTLLDAQKQMGEPRSTPARSNQQKHPAVAVNAAGQFVVAWAEGTGWNKGGEVAWQVFEKDGTPVTASAGRSTGLPVWSMPAVFARMDGTFGIAY